MNLKRWAIAIVSMTVGVGLAIVIFGLPVVRSSDYRAVVAAYSRAQPKQEVARGNQAPEWNFEVALGGDSVVRVEARKFMDVVRLQYSDESTMRTLYEYEDYSNPISIRTAGDRLYVYWHETLVHTDHWLLEFDLQNRQELARLRVDPRDVQDLAPR